MFKKVGFFLNICYVFFLNCVSDPYHCNTLKYACTIISSKYMLCFVLLPYNGMKLKD